MAFSKINPKLEGSTTVSLILLMILFICCVYKNWLYNFTLSLNIDIIGKNASIIINGMVIDVAAICDFDRIPIIPPNKIETICPNQIGRAHV